VNLIRDIFFAVAGGIPATFAIISNFKISFKKLLETYPAKYSDKRIIITEKQVEFYFETI
jgi:hypothetical protein